MLIFFELFRGLFSRKVSHFLGCALVIFLVACGMITGKWLFNLNRSLQQASRGPVDAVLVLGGSIQREIYAAEIAKMNPKIPILISQGSAEPCIWLVFQRAGAPIHQVLLEKCAHSTFDNFNFSLSILQSWKVNKVKVITSASHIPRAQWLAQIMLGSHGIWVDIELAHQKGIPGNRESWLKTSLDLSRATVWAVISQFKKSQCFSVIPLSSVDISTRQPDSFKCEK